MSQMTFAFGPPGFFDLDPANFAADQPVEDDDLTKLLAIAKFAAVRTEPIYMGWYKNGDTIPTPVSPVDGYAYSRAECNMIVSGFFSRPPAAGFVSGQAARPTAGHNSGAGQVLWHEYDVDDSNGVVYSAVGYYVGGGAETDTNDGMVKVHCLAIRSSVNVAN
jgi:hypothetical protein